MTIIHRILKTRRWKRLEAGRIARERILSRMKENEPEAWRRGQQYRYERRMQVEFTFGG